MDKKLFNNYIYNVLYRILITITPLITTPYISRVLQADGTGVYGYTSSVTMLFTLFAALGFGTYGQRETAYRMDNIHERSVLFAEICIFRSVTTIIVLACFCLFSWNYKKYSAYLLPQSLTIASVMFDISWYYQGLENFRITVIRNVIVKISSIACVFLFVKKSEDLLLYILIMSASMLISNVCFFYNIQKYIVKVSFSELHPTKHLKGSIEFFIPLISVEIYSHLDRIMLGYMIPESVESGYYEQTRKITTIIVGLITSINNVMMSRISNLYANEKEDKIVAYYKRTFKFMLLIMVPICTGLIIISDSFVPWFFGDGYNKVSSLLKLSAFLILFMCVGNFAGVQFLIPTGQQNKMTKAYIVAATTNIIFNSFLIPHYASVGAMVASIIAEIISCVLQMRLLMKSEYKFNVFSGLWKYLLAACVMASILLIVNYFVGMNGIIQTCVDVFFGGAVYLFIIVLLKDETFYMTYDLLRKR